MSQLIACTGCGNPMVFALPRDGKSLLNGVQLINIFEIFDELKLSEALEETLEQTAQDLLLLDTLDAYLTTKGLCKLKMCCRKEILTDDREGLSFACSYIEVGGGADAIEDQKYGLVDSEFG